MFLHGWCGHGDEAQHLQSALPGPLLVPSWMPAHGSIDLQHWTGANEPAAVMAHATAMAEVGNQIRRQIRQAILQAGIAGSLLIGHSMGEALACVLAADPAIAARGLVLLDSSVPMPPQRRQDTLIRMGAWIRRAQVEGRSAAQNVWVLDQPNRTDHFFHPTEQMRLQLQRWLAGGAIRR